MLSIALALVLSACGGTPKVASTEPAPLVTVVPTPSEASSQAPSTPADSPVVTSQPVLPAPGANPTQVEAQLAPRTEPELESSPKSDKPAVRDVAPWEEPIAVIEHPSVAAVESFLITPTEEPNPSEAFTAVVDEDTGAVLRVTSAHGLGLKIGSAEWTEFRTKLLALSRDQFDIYVDAYKFMLLPHRAAFQGPELRGSQWTLAHDNAIWAAQNLNRATFEHFKRIYAFAARVFSQGGLSLNRSQSLVFAKLLALSHSTAQFAVYRKAFAFAFANRSDHGLEYNRADAMGFALRASKARADLLTEAMTSFSHDLESGTDPEIARKRAVEKFQ